MSTFQGKLEEIKNISVDRFDEENLNSYAFFLSHCHTDHMIGLHNSLFHERLAEDDVFLYASSVSVEILKRLIPELPREKLKEIPMKGSTLVPVKNKFVSVTPLPAGHCPGSIMFLFEYNNKNILYTGDYRIIPDDFKKISVLYDSAGHLKHIHKLYLDTTFFNISYPYFPARDSSLPQVCEIMEQWIKKSDDHIINIETPARYGQEYLFNEISKHMKMPIHVSEDAYNFYKCIPEMDGTITDDENSTRLHSACGSTYQNICKSYFPKHFIKTVRFSAWVWNKHLLKNGNMIETSNRMVRACYSCHPSLEETQALIKFLKPDAIEACVQPTDSKSKQEMMDLLEECMKEYQKKEEVLPACKQFGLLQNPPKSPQKKENEILNVKFFSLIESPPRKQRRLEDGDSD